MVKKRLWVALAMLHFSAGIGLAQSVPWQVTNINNIRYADQFPVVS